MLEPVYFTKVKFGIREDPFLGWDFFSTDLDSFQYFTIIELDLTLQELAIQDYIQKFRWHHPYLKASPETLDCYGRWENSKLAFSNTMKLTDEMMNQILPLCNALDFEPYRFNENMEPLRLRSDNGELQHFQGMTESYIPMIELPLYVKPVSKLCSFLINDIFSTDPYMKGWAFIEHDPYRRGPKLEHG